MIFEAHLPTPGMVMVSLLDYRLDTLMLAMH